MQVHVYNLYQDTSTVIEGEPAQVEAELLRLFPFLRSEQPDDQGDIHALVEHLNANQAYEAELLNHDQQPMAKAEASNLSGSEHEIVSDMLGYHDKLFRAIEAAKFLCGGTALPEEKVRRALWQADGDPEEAALGAYGLEASEPNLRALRAIQDMSQTRKGEEGAVQAQSVEAGHPDAEQTAEAVRRAFQDEFVVPIKLNGKHAEGTLLARDQDTGEVWLLKPGSGGQTPAAGAKQDPSSQSRREAAFWHLADAWQLGDFIPHTDLLIIDGREYAAIKLLPWSYKTLDKLKKGNASVARTVLDGYRNHGMLHRWAILDFVLGNPDRHANNLMVREGDVKLIDHGSAMAGPAFDPAHDEYSFTPFYLRAWAPGKFSQLTPEQKLKYMPRLDRQAEEGLRAWLDQLHATDIDRVLYRYGVNPEPARERLARLKVLATQEPVDLAINKLWVTV